MKSNNNNPTYNHWSGKIGRLWPKQPLLMQIMQTFNEFLKQTTTKIVITRTTTTIIIITTSTNLAQG